MNSENYANHEAHDDAHNAFTVAAGLNPAERGCAVPSRGSAAFDEFIDSLPACADSPSDDVGEPRARVPGLRAGRTVARS
jgi:hypothetical protein